MPLTSDAELVLAAQAGDEDSFLALCERHYAGMVALAAARLRDRDRAEDVVQETFGKVCRYLGQLKEPEKFGPWLAAICRREVIQALRREASDPVAEPLDESQVAASPPTPDTPARLVREIVDKLPDLLKEAIYLRYYSDLSYDRIADLQGTTRQTVNGRLRRAKQEIAKTLRLRLEREGVIDD